MTNIKTETQETTPKSNRKERTLSDERMTELVNVYIERGKALVEGEKININSFCDEFNIILPLFYQISAEAGQRTGQIFPYETTETKTRISSKHVAVVGKRGNIIIKPVTVENLNKDRTDEEKFVPDDEFDIICSGEQIILNRKKK